MAKSKIKVFNSEHSRPLTEEEKMRAAPLLDIFPNLLLMSGKYRDEEVAFVCTMEKKEGVMLMSPVMIVVTNAMAADCTGPDGKVPEDRDKDKSDA